MLLCIGGVCVPYTAVVPIVILALKWIAVRLARVGLLPKAVADALQVSTSEDKSTESLKAAGPSVVKTLHSDEEFHKLLKDPMQKVVCKFTASWCNPCHKVQPFYEKLSSHYAEQARFFTIDVDEFDEIASKYNVAVMPTFLVVQDDKVLGTYSGSSENELQKFLKEQLGRSE